MTIEDYEDLLVVKPAVAPNAKFEARCPLCSTSIHKWNERDALTWLRSHIADTHLKTVDDKAFVVFH
jgi:hypothetical protein